MTAHIWLGGAFNPPHYGHLALAHALGEQARAQVWLLPTGVSAFGKHLADGQHRVAMLRLACQEFPSLNIDVREIQCTQIQANIDTSALQQGAHTKHLLPSYTVQTLAQIRHEFGCKATLGFALGSDAFATMASWKNPLRIPQLVHVIVIDRDKCKDSGVAALSAHALSSQKKRDESHAVKVQKLTHWIHTNTTTFAQWHKKPYGGVVFWRNKRMDIRATCIRSLCATSNWDAMRAMLPQSVINYIREVKLYT